MSNRAVVSGQLTGTSGSSPVSNSQLAIILFIVAEIMLFGTLMAGYFVLRMGSNNFAGMVYLPVGLTGISTMVLIASSASLYVAQRASKQGRGTRLKLSALLTLALGITFLMLQMAEWQHLISAGHLPASAVNSGMFYMLSGVHGLHVAGGLVLLLIQGLMAFRGKVTPARRGIVELCGAYWHFVTIVWVALFLLLFIL